MVYIKIDRCGVMFGTPDINGIVSIKFGEKESLSFGFRGDDVVSISVDGDEAYQIIKHFSTSKVVMNNCTIPVCCGDVQYWYGDIAKTIFSSCFIIIDDNLEWKIK